MNLRWRSSHLAPMCGSRPSTEFIAYDFPLLSHVIIVALFFLSFFFPPKVQSFGERIVLFILNVIIFGRLERNLDDDDMFFLPHSVKEQAKILWRRGAAVGFYTTKMKGEGCTATTSGWTEGGSLGVCLVWRVPSAPAMWRESFLVD